jgi:DNA-binding PadR family transcriptional regulator
LDDISTFSTGRKHGLLRFWVLNLLTQKQLNGSEIIKEIESNSMGWWKPSPGSIYPLLSKLEEDKLVVRNDDNRYIITDDGRKIVEKHFQRVRHFYNQTNPDDVKSVLENIHSELMFILDSDKPFEGIEEEIQKIENKLNEVKKRLIR